MELKIEISESEIRKEKAQQLEIENLLREIKLTGYDTEELISLYEQNKSTLNKQEFIEQLKETLEFAYNLMSLNYIEESLKDEFNLPALKFAYFNTLNNMRESRLFTEDTSEKVRKKFYKVGYHLIETELIINDRSDILEELLKSDYDTMNINLLIISIIDELNKSSIGNLRLLEELKEMLTQKRIDREFDNYVQKDIITMLIKLTKPKEYVNNIHKKLEKRENEVEINLMDLDNDYKEVEYRVNDIKKSVEKENEKRKKFIKKMKSKFFDGLIYALVMLCFYNFYSVKKIKEQSKVYDVETVIYDTRYGVNFKQEETRLNEDERILYVYKTENGINYKYTYNTKKLEDILLNDEDYKTLDLSDIKPTKKGEVEEEIIEDRRTLITRKADRDNILSYDLEYQKKEKLLLLAVWSTVALVLPNGTTNSIIVILINFIKYLKVKNRTNELYDEIDNELNKFIEEIKKISNGLEEFNKLIEIFETLKKEKCLTDKDIELLEYYIERLTNQKERLNDYIEETAILKRQIDI